MATKPKSKPKAKPKPRPKAKPKPAPKRRARKPLPTTVVKRGDGPPTPSPKRAARRSRKEGSLEEARRRIRDLLIWELQSYNDRAPLEASERRLSAEQLLEDLEKRDRLRRDVIAAIDSASVRMEAFAPPLLRVAPTKHLKVATEAAREHLGDARKALAGIEDVFGRWRDMARTELSQGRHALVSLGWPAGGRLPPHPMLQALAIQLSRLGMTEKSALAELLSFPAWTTDFPHDLLDRIGDLAATWRDCWAEATKIPDRDGPP
jgi:hypothetical protein